MYSRHGPSPPSSHSTSANNLHKTQSYNSLNCVQTNKELNGQSSGYMYYSSGMNSGTRPVYGQEDSLPPKHPDNPSALHRDQQPRARSSNSNSTHNVGNRVTTPQRLLGSRATPPPVYTGSRNKSANSSESTPHLPNISDTTQNTVNVVRSRPPSGSRRNERKQGEIL